VNSGGGRVPEPTASAKVQQETPQAVSEVVAAAELPKTQTTAATPPPPSHPQLTARDLQTHQFFSLHRPLLTLSNPSIFQTPSIFPFEPSTQTHAAAPWEEDTEDTDEDGRADGTALTLWHSLINSKLRSSMDFHSTLANLGSLESKDMQEAVENEVAKVRIQMDSTKRKRRKKMSKHKLKKRRRLERDLRRQQSK